MTRVALLASSLILAVTTSTAQSNTPPSAAHKDAQAPTNFVLPLTGQACPVSMHALQGSGTGLLAVRGQQHVSDVSQKIHLILTNPKSAKIVGAKVKVSGLSSKSRIDQAAVNKLDLTNGKEKSDLTRTLNVSFTPENETEAAADLALPGFTSVLSIQLESIIYMDSSIWTVAGSHACRVAPDPTMLVAGR